jgi:hypothetical protein
MHHCGEPFGLNMKGDEMPERRWFSFRDVVVTLWNSNFGAAAISAFIGSLAGAWGGALAAERIETHVGLSLNERSPVPRGRPQSLQLRTFNEQRRSRSGQPTPKSAFV